MSASLTENVIIRVKPGFQATQKAEKTKFAREARYLKALITNCVDCGRQPGMTHKYADL